MGLRSEITNDLVEALSSDDDLKDASSTVQVVKIKEVEGGDVLGPMSSEESLHTANYAVVKYYDVKNVDGINILMGDKQVTIFQSLLDCTPLAGDHILISGKKSNIVAVSEDPAHVTWSLTVRG